MLMVETPSRKARHIQEEVTQWKGKGKQGQQGQQGQQENNNDRQEQGLD